MRANSTEITYYLYDREDRIGDYDENGNLITTYTHGPGIDEPVAMTIDNSAYFYIPDIQGSIRAIVDTDGNTVATYQCDAWGNIISYNGTLAQHNDYLYTGREYDWQAGIYYYRARYYNPELGRFLSQDPAGMVDGPNMYVYVRNDPVNRVDAWGKWAFTTCIKNVLKEAFNKVVRGTWSDKYAHCWATCTMADRCPIGADAAYSIMLLKEVRDWVYQQTGYSDQYGGGTGWSQEDVNADAAGRDCYNENNYISCNFGAGGCHWVHTGQSCDVCCGYKYGGIGGSGSSGPRLRIPIGPLPTWYRVKWQAEIGISNRLHTFPIFPPDFKRVP